MATNNSCNYSPTDHCVQVGSTSGGLTSVANGTTGQFLGANTGADPTWQTVSTGATIYTASQNITSTQIKALRATPKQIVAAPGAGFAIMIMSVQIHFNYGGSNVFTNGQGLLLRYGASGSNATSLVILDTLYTGSSSNYGFVAPRNSSEIVVYDNLGIFVQNAGSSEITGNAANNNSLTFQTQYLIVPLPV